MGRLLALMVIIAAAAAGARAAVYGSGLALSASPLGGYVLLSAFAGGMALAFSRAFLLVVAPYLTVLPLRRPEVGGHAASGQRVDWGSLVCYLAAFALAFVITIGGFPSAFATPIYRSEWLIDPAGGAIFLAWGSGVVLGFFPTDSVGPPSPVWRRVLSWGPAGALGASTGALMYHELDPAYDSVFFFTGNAVAASHAPATVAIFTMGLGLIYLAAGGAAIAVASRARWGLVAFLGGRILAGVATVLIGLLILTGRFGTLRGLLF